MLKSTLHEQPPPRCLKNSTKYSKNAPKTLPRPPKTPQDGPKIPPRCARNLPRRPTFASRRRMKPPRRRQDVPKTPSRRNANVPRPAQDAQSLPRRPQDLPKEAPDTFKASKNRTRKASPRSCHKAVQVRDQFQQTLHQNKIALICDMVVASTCSPDPSPATNPL